MTSGNGDVEQTWANLRIGIFNTGDNDKVFVEVGTGSAYSTLINNITLAKAGCTDIDKFNFQSDLTFYDNFTICPYNSTTGMERCSSPDPDIVAPSITSFNVTSDEGCESWNTNHDTACSTTDTTPTVKITTSEVASCRIGGGRNSSSFNVNYNSMTSLRNCSTGEWTTELWCTLPLEDELVYDTSYLFISCKDGDGNMNLSTSTSGPLKVSVTGLENAGRTAIGIGIQNALLANYTNYTDQQVYARNIANLQSKGTFDRFAKKGNKAWAINRIGVSDSYVAMFNLTPVLYTLELTNKTSSNITKQVELLINSTK